MEALTNAPLGPCFNIILHFVERNVTTKIIEQSNLVVCTIENNTPGKSSPPLVVSNQMYQITHLKTAGCLFAEISALWQTKVLIAVIKHFT